MTPDGKLTATDRGWLLSIPAGPPGRYRLSQLDDHRGLPRRAYPYRPPMKFELEARVSSASLPGTWGFGLWNDPYGLSFGPGNGFVRLPALPNAAWFFFSSPISYLSFRDAAPANGFLAQVFASPGFDVRLFYAGLTMPFSRKRARRILSRVIREDEMKLDALPDDLRPVARFDPTQWHRYSLHWREEGTSFFVDDTCVLSSALSPRSPLGLVIWLDNQHAGFDPQGRLSFGLEANPDLAWLEIRDLKEG